MTSINLTDLTSTDLIIRGTKLTISPAFITK